jgi:hypothetical protein
MKTIVGMVTPHVLRVMDLANQAENGVNVDWHVRDAVARTLADLREQFNARDLLAAYVHGLESAAADAGPGRRAYANLLKTAAALAARELEERG